MCNKIMKIITVVVRKLYVVSCGNFSGLNWYDMDRIGMGSDV